MAGPWERYQKPENVGPWSKYGQGASSPDQPSTLSDMAQSFGAGVRRGVEGLASFAGDFNALGGKTASWLAEKAGASPETAESIGGAVRRMSIFAGMPTSEQTAQQADELAGDALKHDPQTTAGEYARTFGEFVPAAAGGPGRLATRLITQALLPSIGSETGGQLTEGTAAEPYARFAGGVAGGLAPLAASRLVSPFPTSPERLQAAQTLRAEGVNPTAGQVTGNNTLRFAESELGMGQAAQIMEDQASAFTDAAMRRAGSSGRATPDNMTALRDRLGQGFDDISARNAVRPDQQLAGDMNRMVQEYRRVLPSEQRQIVENLAQDVVDRFRASGGIMSGRDYQIARSRMSRMAQSNRQRDPEFANAIRSMRNALDDAMNRSIRPEDAAEWARLRREYGNMKVLERAATGGGENAGMGLISPAQLRVAAKTGRVGEYARGQGDFDELARAGQTLLTPLPNSGTPARLAVRGLGPGITAALTGGLTGDVTTGLLGAAAGTLLPTAIGRALMTGQAQRYLQNQVASGVRVDPRIAAIASALLANRGPQPALPPPSN